MGSNYYTVHFMFVDYGKPELRQISDLWHLRENVNIVEATLLGLGFEPQFLSDVVEGLSDSHKPSGYVALRRAIIEGIETSKIEGEIFRTSHFAIKVDEAPVSFLQSNVELSSLKHWIIQKGVLNNGFLSATLSSESFRNEAHPRYSSKLVAVVEAWESYDQVSDGVGTPKQKLSKWLRINASRFNLTNEDGAPSENVIEELAKVANWAKSGGAPKTGNSEPEPDQN